MSRAERKIVHEDFDVTEMATIGGGDSKTNILAYETIFAKPLLYFKKRNPLVRQRQKAPGPRKLVMPNGKVCLGFAAENEPHDQQNLDDNIVVFTSPGEDQVNRTKVFACLLYFLLPADLILITTIFFRGAIFNDPVVGDEDVAEGLTYAATLLTICLGVAGIKLEDTRVVSLFMTLFYIDALINLIRVYTVLHFAHFIIQIIICQVMRQFKITLQSTWFSPS